MGRGNVISKKDLQEYPGEYPVYSSSAVGNGEMGQYGKYMFEDERISWSIDGGGKFFYRNAEKYSVTNVCGWIKVINESLLSCKYLYYALLNEWTKKHYDYSHKAHPSVISKEYQIPLPPLAVQSEIVRVLDKFTLHKAELAAELAARLRQYEYYRNKLFTFGDDVERKTLGEIGTFTRGRRFCRTDIVDEGQSCIHYGDIYTYYGLNTTTTKTHLPYDFPVKLRYAEKGDVVIVGAGENDMDIGVGVVWEGNDSVAVHDACYIFKHNMNPRYISHYLRTINYHLQIKKYVNRGKICSISAEGIAKAVIPIPSLAEQERIASILDRFDKLCHDIREGLPAEIELRQKQYEHYRNRLLTFRQLGD